MGRDKRVTAVADANYRAFCENEECGWRKEGVNALALAALHHDKSGHPTRTEKTQTILYGEAS